MVEVRLFCDSLLKGATKVVELLFNPSCTFGSSLWQVRTVPCYATSYCVSAVPQAERVPQADCACAQLPCVDDAGLLTGVD